jgi:hypothetical protein
MRSRVVLSLLVVTAALSMTSCVDEQIVFRDRPIFLEPDPTALEFLGYANPERNDKLTVCGQCHVGQQTTWQATGHAFAWAGLQQSDHAQAFCEACHTVNSLGNVAGPDGQAVGGWVAVNDARYHDVQCESCHGPGLPHVRNPSAEAAHPQAPITVASGDMTFGCAQCHSGFHHPFVDEWSESAHGNVTSYAATRRDNAGGCWSCHSGEGALQKFGVRSNYLEKAALVDRNEGFAHITCAVCHDPHSNEYEGQLRFPSNTGNIDTHICAQCHNRATVPGVGPRGLSVHSPEAPLLDGVLHTVGWIPPGMEHDVDQIRGSHAGEGNPSLCTTCHMVPFETFDPQANRTFFATGHSFDAIPCVDANGMTASRRVLRSTAWWPPRTSRPRPGGSGAGAERHGPPGPGRGDWPGRLRLARPATTPSTPSSPTPSSSAPSTGSGWAGSGRCPGSASRASTAWSGW